MTACCPGWESAFHDLLCLLTYPVEAMLISDRWAMSPLQRLELSESTPVPRFGMRCPRWGNLFDPTPPLSQLSQWIDPTCRRSSTLRGFSARIKTLYTDDLPWCLGSQQPQVMQPCTLLRFYVSAKIRANPRGIVRRAIPCDCLELIYTQWYNCSCK